VNAEHTGEARLKCRDIASGASDYVDQHLGFRQRIAFACHLLICDNCRAFLRHWRQALALYRRMPASTLTDHEAKAIADRATAGDRKSRS
jgi:hypothetical protein